MPARPPLNLHLSRTAGVTISLVAFVSVIAALGIGVLTAGVDQQSTPLILSMVGIVGAAVPGLVAALKATEAADTSAESHRLVELTVSQNANVLQALVAHCVEICPRRDCGLIDLAKHEPAT